MGYDKNMEYHIRLQYVVGQIGQKCMKPLCRKVAQTKGHSDYRSLLNENRVKLQIHHLRGINNGAQRMKNILTERQWFSLYKNSGDKNGCCSVTAREDVENMLDVSLMCKLMEHVFRDYIPVEIMNRLYNVLRVKEQIDGMCYMEESKFEELFQIARKSLIEIAKYTGTNLAQDMVNAEQGEIQSLVDEYTENYLKLRLLLKDPAERIMRSTMDVSMTKAGFKDREELFGNPFVQSELSGKALIWSSNRGCKRSQGSFLGQIFDIKGHYKSVKESVVQCLCSFDFDFIYKLMRDLSVLSLELTPYTKEGVMSFIKNLRDIYGQVMRGCPDNKIGSSDFRRYWRTCEEALKTLLRFTGCSNDEEISVILKMNLRISGLRRGVSSAVDSARNLIWIEVSVSGHYLAVTNIGAGAAGSVLANRLTEDNHVTVLVLEAGGEEHDPLYDIPWNAPAAMMTKADWQFYSEPQEHGCLGMKEQRQYTPRGKGLGGSTLVNGLAYVRGSRYDYDMWAANGNKGWGYDDILPYFKKVENVQIDDLKNKEYRSTSGNMKVSDTLSFGISHTFVEAAADIGYKVKDCNGEDNGWQKGFCRMQAIVGDSIRFHSARGYLWPAMKRQNLHVAINAHVQKVIIEKGKAIGIEAIIDGRKHKILSNKEVILSAGAIGSPHILQLSGVGPKSLLNKLQIPVIKDLPAGIGLQDHVMFFVKASISAKISATPDKINSWWTWIQYYLFGTGYLATNAGVEATAWLCTDPNIQEGSYRCPDSEVILLSSLAEHGDSYEHFNYKQDVEDDIYGRIHGVDDMPEGFTVALETAHPLSRGYVLAQSTDPFDYPRISPNYFENPYDVQPIIRAVRMFQKLLKGKTMQKVGAKLWTQPIRACKHHVEDSDEYWECMIRHISVSGYHHSSSCRMGPKTDNTAVVDSELSLPSMFYRVHGIESLRIVDASVMPAVTSGNTMAPTLMIAEKAADLIRGIKTV
ncbi:hypothetical protein FSP39_009567 [Pinctada imbricata]|uniref:Glucose-methanol-choline oxidoreductase N-terminal domain-containing protein n=1 Tax=Pinctada imbricata TaxID=66713 RepID=A0AA88XJR2_PINIB|nr:hypothetical protein FSP39_009567 [Pinctada imbricata]